MLISWTQPLSLTLVEFRVGARYGVAMGKAVDLLYCPEPLLFVQDPAACVGPSQHQQRVAFDQSP